MSLCKLPIIEAVETYKVIRKKYCPLPVCLFFKIYLLIYQNSKIQRALNSLETDWVIKGDDIDAEWKCCDFCGRCGCFTREPFRLCLLCSAKALAIGEHQEIVTKRLRELVESAASVLSFYVVVTNNVLIPKDKLCSFTEFVDKLC